MPVRSSLRALVLLTLLLAGSALLAAVPIVRYAPAPVLAGPGNAGTHIAPPARTSRAVPTATIQVTYTGFTPAAQAAFQYAVDIWETQIASAVPITVDAHWVAMGDTRVLGSGGPTYGYPAGDRYNCAALANALAGRDLVQAKYDIEVNFNSDFPAWYFGTDGQTPAGKYDFVSVVLHELGHGLGFIGTPVMLSGTADWYNTLPYAYDIFVVNGSGQQLFNQTNFPTPSAALAQQLTSNNLYFSGVNAIARAGGMRPKLYAPAVWEQGSSYSHLDETSYAAGNANSLMTPVLRGAEAVHDPGPITRGIFRDLGWTVASEGQAGVDLLIRNSGDSDFIGGGLIQLEAGSTKTQTVSNAGTAVYELALVNTGDSSDSYTLTLDPLPLTDCTVVAYSALSGGSNITTALLGAGWTTPPIAPNSRQYLRIAVTLHDTVAGNAFTALRVTAAAQNDGTKSDAVIAKTVKRPLSTVDLVADLGSPQSAGTPITLRAQASGGGVLEYRFRAGYADATNLWHWSELSSPLYQTTPQCTWTPTMGQTYTLVVMVREQGSTASYQVYNTLPFTIEGPLTAVGLAVGPTPVPPVGKPLTLTATATGGQNITYRFRAGYKDAATDLWQWQELSSPLYQAGATCSWTPREARTYTLVVYTREAGSPATYDVYAATNVTIPATTLTAVRLTATPSGTVAVNTPVTLTALPTGGGMTEYRFRVGAPDLLTGAWAWTELTNPIYRTFNSCTWIPRQAGTWTLVVYARPQGNASSYTVYAAQNISVSGPLATVALKLSTNTPLCNTPVTLTALPAGGTAPEYRFRAGYPDASGVWRWTELSSPLYQNGTTCLWTPTEARSYTLVVYAREAGSTATYDVYATAAATVPATLLTAVRLTTAPSGTVAVNTPVTLTALPTGGGMTEYRFRVGAPDLLTGAWVWTELTNPIYRTFNSCTWIPRQAGSWTLVVCARPQGSTSTYTVYATQIVSVSGPLARVALKLSTDTPILNTPVTLTALSTGGTEPEYRFRAGYQDASGVWRWTELSSPLYQSGTTCPWTPTEARTYTLVVCIRERGSTASYAVYSTRTVVVGAR